MKKTPTPLLNGQGGSAPVIFLVSGVPEDKAIGHSHSGKLELKVRRNETSKVFTSRRLVT